MDCKVTFINCGYNGTGASTLISIDKYIRAETKVVTRVLVNCGDSTMRLLSEKHIKLHMLSIVVITSLAPHNISGFPAIFLALSDWGVGEIAIYGPVGVKAYLNMMLPFINRKYPVLNIYEIEDDPLETRFRGGLLRIWPVFTIEQPRKTIAIATAIYPQDQQSFDFADSSEQHVITFIPSPYYFEVSPSIDEIAAVSLSSINRKGKVVFVSVPMAVASCATKVLDVEENAGDEGDSLDEQEQQKEIKDNEYKDRDEMFDLEGGEENTSQSIEGACAAHDAVGVIMPNTLAPQFIEFCQSQVSIGVLQRLCFPIGPQALLQDEKTNRLDPFSYITRGSRHLLCAKPGLEIVLELKKRVGGGLLGIFSAFSPQSTLSNCRRRLEIQGVTYYEEDNRRVVSEKLRKQLALLYHVRANQDKQGDEESVSASAMPTPLLALPPLPGEGEDISSPTVPLISPAMMSTQESTLSLQMEKFEANQVAASAIRLSLTNKRRLTSQVELPSDPSKRMTMTIEVPFGDGSDATSLSVYPSPLSNSIITPSEGSTPFPDLQRIPCDDDDESSDKNNSKVLGEGSIALTRMTTDDLDILSVDDDEVALSNLSVAEVCPPNPVSDVMKITFLGTGCAKPSKHRSNSSIMITLRRVHPFSPPVDAVSSVSSSASTQFNFSGNKEVPLFSFGLQSASTFSSEGVAHSEAPSTDSREPDPIVILDLGEGTAGQLFQSVGGDLDRYDELLVNIKVIWISHHHADHATGLPMLLHQIQRAHMRKRRNHKLKCIRSGINRIHRTRTPSMWNKYELRHGSSFSPKYEENKIMLISSEQVLKYCEFSASVAGLDDLLLFYPITSTLYAGMTSDIANATNGLVSRLQSVPVQHCPGSFGIVLELASGHKIVYSGDCRPSQSLIKCGQYCDLLIHEATFDDDKDSDANKKKHCTVSEARQVSRSMQAKHTILTHFSQRYPAGGSGVASLAETDISYTSFAFDFLQFSFPSQMTQLPTATRAISQTLRRMHPLDFSNEIEE